MAVALVGTDSINKIWNRGFELAELSVSLPIAFLVSFVVAWILWRENERKFKRYAPLELDDVSEEKINIAKRKA